MTRQDIMKVFPNATEEQIQNILNSHHSELETEKEKNKNLKSAAKELEDARKELEDLRSKVDESAPDDWKTQLEKLTQANEAAQRQLRDMELKNSLLGKGFGETDVDAYIKAINEGGDIASVLATMKDNVISAHDKERMNNTPDPSGTPANGGKEIATSEKLAASLVGDFKTESQNNVLANYM